MSTPTPTLVPCSATTPLPVSVKKVLANVTAPRLRRGIVYDKWPFRLDISTEYQDWILIAVCCALMGIWCMPCICGGMRTKGSRRFTVWVYSRLHTFFCVVTYINLFVLACTVTVLPDWTLDEFFINLLAFLTWVLVHLKKMLTSSMILFAFYMLVKFRERIAVAAGIEHVQVFRFSWRTLFSVSSKVRPIEVHIWKVEELQSSGGKVLKPNDIFVECHMGNNEPMRTRVHNNAGSSCVVRESFQMNIDEDAPSSLMTLLIKDQALVSSRELARITLSTREVFGIEDQTGKRSVEFNYSPDDFVALSLLPRGSLWVRISPVSDVDEEEKEPLMNEDSLVTC